MTGKGKKRALDPPLPETEENTAGAAAAAENRPESGPATEIRPPLKKQARGRRAVTQTPPSRQSARIAGLSHPILASASSVNASIQATPLPASMPPPQSNTPLKSSATVQRDGVEGALTKLRNSIQSAVRDAKKVSSGVENILVMEGWKFQRLGNVCDMAIIVLEMRGQEDKKGLENELIRDEQFVQGCRTILNLPDDTTGDRYKDDMFRAFDKLERIRGKCFDGFTAFVEECVAEWGRPNGD